MTSEDRLFRGERPRTPAVRPRAGLACAGALAAAIFLLRGGAFAAGAGEPAQPQPGEAVFQAHCVACHPDLRNVLEPDKPIRGSARLKDLEAFVSWIRDPVTPMPAFPAGVISDAQAADLYRYLAPAAPKP